MHQGAPWMVPGWIFINFLWILGPPLETLWGHFSVFSVILGVKKYVWIAGVIFDDLWMASMLRIDVPTSQKHYKYNGFHEISLFWRFCDFDDSRHLLGPHFGGFWRSLGTSLMISEGIRIPLEFHWIPWSVLLAPESRVPSWGVLRCSSLWPIATILQHAGSCKKWNLQAEGWQAWKDL